MRFQDCEKHLEKALDARKGFFSETSPKDTNAFRFFGGSAEGISGLMIEVFGEVAFFQIHKGQCTLYLETLMKIAEWCGKKLKVHSVYRKEFVADRSHAAEAFDHKNAQPFWGTRANSEIIIVENGLRYEIHPYDGFSVGLFLDQRENRKFFLEQTDGKRVLNLFSYTCGFSLACAYGGASVTSVDTSKKFLEWGKRNFLLNKLSLESHKWVCRDAMEYLDRLKESFDVVIVDPPSFGRSDKGVFSLKRDWRKLLASSARILAKEGCLLFSTNLQSWPIRKFRKEVLDELKLLNLKFDEIEIPIPKDFEKANEGLRQILIKLS